MKSFARRVADGVRPAVMFVRSVRLGLVLALALTLATVSPTGLEAQALARPMLQGQALLGDTAMTEGVVVLHHVSEGARGSSDSLRLGPDGDFVFPLPGSRT